MLWLTLTAIAAPPSTDPPQIVGGEIVEHDGLQAIAALYAGDTYLCTGVLIHPDVVLTAGHCVTGLTHVVLDTVDLLEPGERVEVDRPVVYPDYLETYDLAVVLLEEEATTEPVPLAYACRLDSLEDGSSALIAGFGANNNFGTRIDGLLREAFIPIVDADCDNPTRGCNLDVSPAGELIAGGDGVDSCNGDSGGPLFLLVGEEAFLLGITSRASLPSNRPCGGGGIYVRIDAARRWIEQEGGFLFGDVFCGDPGDANRPPTLQAEAITVHAGDAVTVPLVAEDADDDALTLSVVIAPAHGEVTIAGLTARYAANTDFVGLDSFVLSVTDNGQPLASAQTTVPVLVLAPIVEEPAGCGCTSAAPAPWLAAVATGLLAAIRRRRTTGAA